MTGRGLGLGAAQELALKFKETCGLHAEAFSSAELRHGPYPLLGENSQPFIRSVRRDASRVETLALELARRGVPIIIAGASLANVEPLRSAGATVPALEVRAEIAPLLLVHSANQIAALSVRRRFYPDRPAPLHKFTETV